MSDSGHVDLAIANAAPNAIGFATNVVAAGSTGQYLTEGQIEIPNLVASDSYFLSVSSPRMITNTAPTDPGDYVVSLGRAVSESSLEIEIQLPILLTGNQSASGFTTETFTVTDSQEITLASEPSEVAVFQNGLFITDYSLSGSTLTFDCLDEGDFVVVEYV